MALQMQPYQKYTKVPQAALPSNPDQHEIRITTNKLPKIYINRALYLFRKKNLEHVILKASGAAISTLCISAEIIRNTLKNLHQLNKITNTTIIDVYEPNEEGLDTVTVERKMAILEVKLMKEVTADEIKAVGYQAALDPDFNPEEKKQITMRGFRGIRREPMRFNRFRSRGQRRGMMSFRGRFRSRGSRGNFNQRMPQQQNEREYQEQYQYRGRPRRMMYTKFQIGEREEVQREYQNSQEMPNRPVMRRPMQRRPRY